MRLCDAPVDIARRTQRWLSDQTGSPSWSRIHDYDTVVADQVRELSIALRRTAQGLTEVIEAVLDATRHDSAGAGAGTVSVEIDAVAAGSRMSADIVTTMDLVAAANGNSTLAVPSGTGRFVAWIADEIEEQTDGRPPAGFAVGQRAASPPCPLLRAASGLDRDHPLIHAYRHAGFTAQELATIRASRLSAALVAQPGATIVELMGRSATPRRGLLAELGDLIELGATFGIDHRWYPYDITTLALRDVPATGDGCGCPTLACRRP